MQNILILYHTQTGATEQMAKAVVEGARAAGGNVVLKHVTQATIDDVTKYDYYVWGTGNYFQTMAGMVWDYFDKYYYEWLKMPAARNKVYSCVCSAGVGGAMCLNSLNHELRGLGWKRAFDPVTAFNMPTSEVLEQCRELGKKIVALKPEQVVDLNPPKQPRFTWPEKLHMIAWSGVGVEITKSWAPLLTEATKMKVCVAPESNTVNRFKWLGLKLFQLTAGGTTETSQMIMADRKYAARDTGPFPIRSVWAQSKSASGMFVRGDSPIKTIYDLRPCVRVCDMLPYAASTRIVDAFLAWAKIDKKDVVWVPGKNYRENVMQVVEGKADVCFGIPTSPAVWEAEKNPHGLHWIAMDPKKDPEGATRYWEVDPLVTFGVMFNGVPSAVGVPSNVGISLYCTHADTAPMMIHRLARWFDESYPKFKDRHPWNEWMKLDTLMEELEHTFIPAHEGLVRFLKEKEVWTVAHDERNKKNIELIDRYVKAYQEAKDMADEKLIPIQPDSPAWIELWENYKKELGLPVVKLFKSLKED